MRKNGNIKLEGHVTPRLIKGYIKAPLRWKIWNVLHKAYWKNWFKCTIAKLWADLTGTLAATGKLSVKLIKGNGQTVDYGTVAHGLVTTAFVNLLVDEMQGAASLIDDFKYHDSGEGTTGAAVGDTDIETTDGESRVVGSQTEGASANIYKSVGTITYTTSKAITEHGLFCQSTGATLLDRHTFTAINVVNTDQIEFTYELTVSAGG